MTVRTPDDRTHTQRRDQTHHVPVVPRSDDRMVRRVARLELKPRVRLRDLPIDHRFPQAIDAVCVALEADLVLKP